MVKSKKVYFSLLVFIFILAYIAWVIFRPLPVIKPIIYPSTYKQVKTISKLAWPNSIQAAVGINGTKILDKNQQNNQLPTASTAKMLTALVVLEKYPLKLNENGPTITLSSSDVNIYNSYASKQGSVVQVVNGEQISEYQMLEALLLPSANNIADSLAIWSYGSINMYKSAATKYLSVHNINFTTVGDDASGYLPSTKSTATDLVKIGELVMSNPVLADIVSKKSATGIPVANNIKNVNYLLGQYGVIGVKTGNTDQAGGVYVSAVKVNLNKQSYTLVTSIIGASSLATAMNQSVPLIKTAEANISSTTFLSKNSRIARYNVPWQNQPIYAVTASNTNTYTWGGSKIYVKNISLSDLNKTNLKGSKIGKLSITSSLNNTSYSDVILSGSVIKPSIFWRLSHPY